MMLQFNLRVIDTVVYLHSLGKTLSKIVRTCFSFCFSMLMRKGLSEQIDQHSHCAEQSRKNRFCSGARNFRSISNETISKTEYMYNYSDIIVTILIFY